VSLQCLYLSAVPLSIYGPSVFLAALSFLAALRPKYLAGLEPSLVGSYYLQLASRRVTKAIIANRQVQSGGRTIQRWFPQDHRMI